MKLAFFPDQDDDPNDWVVQNNQFQPQYHYPQQQHDGLQSFRAVTPHPKTASPVAVYPLASSPSPKFSSPSPTHSSAFGPPRSSPTQPTNAVWRGPASPAAGMGDGPPIFQGNHRQQFYGNPPPQQASHATSPPFHAPSPQFHAPAPASAWGQSSSPGPTHTQFTAPIRSTPMESHHVSLVGRPHQPHVQAQSQMQPQPQPQQSQLQAQYHSHKPTPNSQIRVNHDNLALFVNKGAQRAAPTPQSQTQPPSHSQPQSKQPHSQFKQSQPQSQPAPTSKTTSSAKPTHKPYSTFGARTKPEPARELEPDTLSHAVQFLQQKKLERQNAKAAPQQQQQQQQARHHNQNEHRHFERIIKTK